MRKTTKVFKAGLMGMLVSLSSACSSEQEYISGSALLNFVSQEDQEGNCRHERIDVVDTAINGHQLVAIRGEAKYILPQGTTEIPFQSVHKYPDENGISDIDAIVLLNYPGTCAELAIDIVIEYCEYYTDAGRQKLPCPPIEIRGQEGFSTIELRREDFNYSS